jgi:hypothetical protein
VYPPKIQLLAFTKTTVGPFIVAMFVKILGTPTISGSSVTKIPFTLLSQPFWQLLDEGNLSFQNTG